MKINHLFILVLFITACQSEQKKLQSEIEHAEKALIAEMTKEKATALFQLYETYRTKYPADKAKNTQYLRQEANFHLQIEQPYESALAYLQYLEQSAEKATVANDTLFQSALSMLRSGVFDEKTNRVDAQAANDFMEIAEAYAQLRPQDTLTPDLLFQAADVAGAVRDYERSLAYFEQINTAYPDYSRASQALFMRAFVLDSELKRYPEAKALYEAFLQKYPNDELAPSAKFSLQNLGKSEEEIIQEFLKRQENSQ